SANSECSVASLIATGGNNPAGVGEHYDVEKISHLKCVDPFAFDSELGFGDHCLQSADASLVATPIGFVSDEEKAVLQMAVELADDLLARRDLETVLAEYALQQSD